MIKLFEHFIISQKEFLSDWDLSNREMDYLSKRVEDKFLKKFVFKKEDGYYYSMEFSGNGVKTLYK